MFDGDTVFTLATGGADAPDPVAFHALLEAAATCVTRAVARGVLAATSVRDDPPAAPRREPEEPGKSPPATPATPTVVRVRSYRDAFPSAF